MKNITYKKTYQRYDYMLLCSTILFLLLFKSILYLVLHPFVIDAQSVYQIYSYDIYLLLMFTLGCFLNFKKPQSCFPYLYWWLLPKSYGHLFKCKSNSWIWLSKVDHYGTLFSSLSSKLYGTYLRVAILFL